MHILSGEEHPSPPAQRPAIPHGVRLPRRRALGGHAGRTRLLAYARDGVVKASVHELVAPHDVHDAPRTEHRRRDAVSGPVDVHDPPVAQQRVRREQEEVAVRPVVAYLLPALREQLARADLLDRLASAPAYARGGLRLLHHERAGLLLRGNRLRLESAPPQRLDDVIQHLSPFQLPTILSRIFFPAAAARRSSRRA